MREVIIINDILGGCMGERVFWNYMLEGISDLVGIDGSVVPFKSNGWDFEVKKYIADNYPKDTIIIQNATFIPHIDSERYTIAFLQDNIRDMHAQRKHINWQTATLQGSQHIVTNSQYTADAYAEYAHKTTIIPIGVDNELFSPKNNPEAKKKPTGIFVGALNKVKGWPRVKQIIDRNKQYNFIVVTKDGKTYNTDNCTSYSRIDQDKLNDLFTQADFFLIGSPVETQCLAALEAGFADLPIIMPDTGIFQSMSKTDKDALGYFGDALEESIPKVLKNNIKPRKALMNMGFGIDAMISKWKVLLDEVQYDHTLHT
jgi:glycosyltransferase involved in cell wall biosynthesis